MPVIIAYERPIIAVLVENSVIQKLNKQQTAFRSYQRIQELSRASQESKVTLYFFSIKNLDIVQKKINGTYYCLKSNLWKQKEYPFPNILYNRRGEKRNDITFLKMEENFKEIGVLNINAKSYFDKWDVYDKLHQNTEVSPYLPFTQYYKTDEDIINFLAYHDAVYLKGVRGGRGKWIFKIKKLSNDEYEYSYFTDEMIVEKVDDVNSLLSAIHKFFKGNHFIIQKSIDLIQLDESKVDFRAEMQRNGKGELSILGISARVGRTMSPITIHSSAYPIVFFLREILHYSDEKMESTLDEVHDFLFTIYHAIEESYGTFGEIGIDFAIDESERIWFIEPNSRSAKVSLMKAFDETTFHLSFVNPVEYGKFLYRQSKNLTEREITPNSMPWLALKISHK